MTALQLSDDSHEHDSMILSKTQDSETYPLGLVAVPLQNVSSTASSPTTIRQEQKDSDTRNVPSVIPWNSSSSPPSSSSLWKQVCTNTNQQIAMICNFSASYHVVTISIVLPILRWIYHHSNNSNSNSDSDLPNMEKEESHCASSILLGMILGQLIGGTLGDLLGVPFAIVLILGLQIVAGGICTFSSLFWTYDSTSLFSDGNRNIHILYGTLLRQLAFWRFWLGMGCGGIYPLAAVLSSRTNSTKKDSWNGDDRSLDKEEIQRDTEVAERGEEGKEEEPFQQDHEAEQDKNHNHEDIEKEYVPNSSLCPSQSSTIAKTTMTNATTTRRRNAIPRNHHHSLESSSTVSSPPQLSSSSTSSLINLTFHTTTKEEDGCKDHDFLKLQSLALTFSTQGFGFLSVPFITFCFLTFFFSHHVNHSDMSNHDHPYHALVLDTWEENQNTNPSFFNMTLSATTSTTATSSSMMRLNTSTMEEEEQQLLLHTLDLIWRLVVVIGTLPGIILLIYLMKISMKGDNHNPSQNTMGSCSCPWSRTKRKTKYDTRSTSSRNIFRSIQLWFTTRKRSSWFLLPTTDPVQVDVLETSSPMDTSHELNRIENEMDTLEECPVTMKTKKKSSTSTSTNSPTTISLWQSIRSEENLFRKLFGTAGTWFLLDIVFYGNALFQQLILEVAFNHKNIASDELMVDVSSLSSSSYYSLQDRVLIVNDNESLPTIQSLIKTTRDSTLLCLLALPGYLCTVLLLGKRTCRVIQQTPRYIQIQGFVCMTLLYSTLGIWWNSLIEHRTLLVFLYGGTFFFSNYGPNSITFMLPSLTFSVRCRSTLNGVCAASGKLGAILGALMFQPIAQQFGPQTVMFFCAVVCVVACVVTIWCIPLFFYSSTA